ncbi:MAG: YkvA family protein [Patescibacteria group bacterium]|nr:YkvA family protein [Patescibacteria group bacterium]
MKFLFLLYKFLRLYFGFLWSSKTPFSARTLLWGALAYFLLPFDIIPDFLLLTGQLDDVLLVGLLVYAAFRFIPKDYFRCMYKQHISPEPLPETTRKTTG